MAGENRQGSIRHVVLAILAAALYAMSVPLSKDLMESADAGAMAGLLYLGAGAGMWMLLATRRIAGRQSSSRPMERRDMPYVAGMVVLDIAAPLLLMAGLAASAAESVSLLGNFEIVATALFARALFGEAPGPWFLLALTLMVLGSWLSLPRFDVNE